VPAVRLVPPQEWPTLGWDVIDWIETHLVHGPGDVQGDAIVLDDEWCQFLLDAYRIYPQGHAREGKRVVTEAELSRPKGRAKSELAGMVVCVEFLGPVRFAGWLPDGAPVAAPVQYPFIRCLATEEGQSGNTYDNVTYMLGHLKETWPARFGDLDVGLTRCLKTQNGGGQIIPSTASGSAKDGGKETFVVGDEDHLYVTPELRRMHAVCKRNLSKRKTAEPWMLTTTTQFLPGQDSIAERNRDEAEAQIAGKRRRRLGFLFDHREGFLISEADRNNDELLLTSLREAYGTASEWMDLDRILEDECKAHGVDWHDVERYWLNLRSAATAKAVDLAVWDRLLDMRKVPDGAEVVLCFDGSKSRDATALLVWEIADTPHLDAVAVWERPPDAPPSWVVPRDQVDGEVHAAFDRWNVRCLVADPPFWQEYLDRWAETFGEDRVIEFPTMSGARMGPAVSRFLDEAVPDGSFTHSGDLVLRRHVGNAIRAKTRGGYPSVAKQPGKDSLKIDALVAAIIGYDTAAELEPLLVVDHTPVVIRL